MEVSWLLPDEIEDYLEMDENYRAYVSLIVRNVSGGVNLQLLDWALNDGEEWYLEREFRKVFILKLLGLEEAAYVIFYNWFMYIVRNSKLRCNGDSFGLIPYLFEMIDVKGAL